MRRAVLAVVVALDPGEDQEPLPSVGVEQELLDGLEEELRRDFALACIDLASQRPRQRPGDVTRQKGSIGERRTSIDLLLDMYLLHREIRADRAEDRQPVLGPRPDTQRSLDAA